MFPLLLAGHQLLWLEPHHCLQGIFRKDVTCILTEVRVCVCVHVCIIMYIYIYYIHVYVCVQCKCNAFVCIWATEHANHRMYRCSVVQDMYGKIWENVWKGSILSMWIEISFFWEKIFGDSKFCCHGARFSAFTAATAAADPGRGFGWTIFGRERKEAASRRRRIGKTGRPHLLSQQETIDWGWTNKRL